MPPTDYFGSVATNYYDSKFKKHQLGYHKGSFLFQLITNIVLEVRQSPEHYQLILKRFDLLCFLNLFIS